MSILAVDDLDTRRELFVLLGHLSQEQRQLMLQEIVGIYNQQIQQLVPEQPLVEYDPGTGEIQECYMDLVLLSTGFMVPMQPILVFVESWVSKHVLRKG